MDFHNLHHVPVIYFVKLCALHAENDVSVILYFLWWDNLLKLYSDDVAVTGVLTSKWSSDLKDVRCDLDPVLIANNLR